MCESTGRLLMGPNASVTFQPARAAASAIATPIRPDDRFPMNRTASIGSWVGPAVIRRRRAGLLVGCGMDGRLCNLVD